MTPHNTSQEELLKELQTSAAGLSSQEARQRLERYGENKLAEKRKKTNLQRFLDQFKDVMILILLLAAAVSFVVACFGHDPMEFFEPVLILLIVVLNALLGMMQESKAEKAMDALKNMSAPTPGCSGMGRSRSSTPPSWCPVTSSAWRPGTSSPPTPGC